MTCRALVGMTIVAALAGRADAAATPVNIPIVNAGFEADVLQDGFWIDGIITGWTVFGLTAGPQNWTDLHYPGATDNDDIPSTLPGGNNGAFIRSPLAGFYQVLDAPLEPNTRYRLDFYVGDRFDTIMPYWVAELFGGETELAYNDTGVIPGNGQWRSASLTYTTGATHPEMGKPLGIQFYTYGFVDPPNLPGIYQVNIDNVRLIATAVPEPASLAGACMAAAWPAGIGRRRRPVARRRLRRG